MAEKRTKQQLGKALKYLSRLESGQSLYWCFHDVLGMSNEEIGEAGYNLQEYYVEDTQKNVAAASSIQLKIGADKDRGVAQREPEGVPAPVPYQRLRDLIQSPFLEVSLTHEEEYHKDTPVIPELCIDILTEAGKTEWADILDAEVCQVYMGLHGLEVSLVGVSPSRLEAFSSVLTGQCTDELYEKWVADTEEIYLARTQQMKR